MIQGNFESDKSETQQHFPWSLRELYYTHQRNQQMFWYDITFWNGMVLCVGLPGLMCKEMRTFRWNKYQANAFCLCPIILITFTPRKLQTFHRAMIMPLCVYFNVLLLSVECVCWINLVVFGCIWFGHNRPDDDHLYSNWTIQMFMILHCMLCVRVCDGIRLYPERAVIRISDLHNTSK